LPAELLEEELKGGKPKLRASEGGSAGEGGEGEHKLRAGEGSVGEGGLLLSLPPLFMWRLPLLVLLLLDRPSARRM
jgi:hypothetical protein